jgi:hypothetical protein
MRAALVSLIAGQVQRQSGTNVHSTRMARGLHWGKPAYRAAWIRE